MSLEVIPGTTPLVLVAPHGGRRDPVRRPWDSGPLKVNDLHTASLAAELAAATGAGALINPDVDRNDVDLNRVSAAHDRAPEFLEQLAELLESALARHGHATLLTVHGWNVIQPAVDLGLGCTPGAEPFAAGPGAAVSAAFAARAVHALAEACAARGISATVGARYPARARENLLQLFTPRYRDDPRPMVRRLAALAARTEAVQLELGIPLRWPGSWRRQFLAACGAALPELTGQPAASSPAPLATPEARAVTAERPVWQTLQVVGDDLAGLARIDSAGGRLLLFPADGGVVIFTGERTGGEAPGRVGGLTMESHGAAGLLVRYRGPFLRYPDTLPFLDLEDGFGRARLVEGDVALAFAPDHATDATADFGRVSGTISLDGIRLPVAAHGFVERGAPPPLWPRVRVALRLDAGRALSVTLTPDGSTATGFVCERERHLPVVAARASTASGETLRIEVELAGGEQLLLSAATVHRLPVVRQQGATTLRLLFATCRLDGAAGPAGWCEIAGI